MFVLNMPVEQLEPPMVMIAQASPSQQRNAQFHRTVGVCHLVENPRDVSQSSADKFNPLHAINIYSMQAEKREVGISGQVSLLERPMHGTIKMDKEGDVQYTPTSGYSGSDRAIFLVEMDSQKYRVVFSLNLLSQVPDPSEYYDPYSDKKYCPYGKYWRFSGNVEAAWNVR